MRDCAATCNSFAFNILPVSRLESKILREFPPNSSDSTRPRGRGVYPIESRKESHEAGEADDELAASLMKINSELRDEVVGECELSKGRSREGELADAEQADAELRNRDHAEGELSDGDDADGRNRPAVWEIFEGNVQPGEA